MRYRITHHTTYTYEGIVTSSYGTVGMVPRELDWQHVESEALTVSPQPQELSRYTDDFGNTKTYFHVETDHSQLRVTGRSVVEVRAPRGLDATSVAWEEAAPQRQRHHPHWWRLVDFTLPSPRADITDDVRDYAAPSFSPRRPVAEACVELMHRIYHDFDYRPGSTSVTTRVDTALHQRSGVCQDFAHVMVAGLRAHGLAARYVSGYLATKPPPGKPRAVGADASHAWVACWIPDHGWLALDPTNNRLCDESHATVAWGRDYGDVAPVRGVIYAHTTGSRMGVSVDMAPLADRAE